MIPKPLLTGILVLVSVVFAANYALQFIVEGYESDPAIIGVFGTIVGAALVLSKKDGKSKDDDGGDAG